MRTQYNINYVAKTIGVPDHKGKRIVVELKLFSSTMKKITSKIVGFSKE